MQRVEIIFTDVHKARAFMAWLAECGEQYYFEDMNSTDPDNSVARFHYHDNHFIIIAEGERSN